jgi:hypothetical protein
MVMAERKAFLLRMEPGLWAELEAWASDELRSVNGQIEYVLKQAVAKRKGTNENPSSSLQSPPAGIDATGP